MDRRRGVRVLLMHGLETAEDGGAKAAALRAGTNTHINIESAKDARV